jgi:hypothetical protein
VSEILNVPKNGALRAVEELPVGLSTENSNGRDITSPVVVFERTRVTRFLVVGIIYRVYIR